MAMNKPDFASRPLIPAALFLTALYAALAFAPLRAETAPLSIIAISVPLAAALIALSVIDL